MAKTKRRIFFFNKISSFKKKIQRPCLIFLSFSDNVNLIITLSIKSISLSFLLLLLPTVVNLFLGVFLGTGR